MSTENDVWLLCVADEVRFYVVGAYSSQAKALEELQRLPRENHYQLFKAPIDTFFGFIDKGGRLQSGMGNLWHEHYVPA